MFLTEFEPQITQPVASHYTDYSLFPYNKNN